MDGRDSNSKVNDALQSGEDRPALGQDARSFGQGGQVVQREFEPGHNDAADRATGRDQSVPEFDRPEGKDR